MRAPSALGRRDFRSLWLAGLISDAGDWLLLIALPIVVYDATGSALGTSAAFLLELAPGIVLAPLAGRVADRRNRRRTLVVVAVLQAIALLPLLAAGGPRGLPVIYTVIVVQASLMTLFDPAKNALLPTLVAADEVVSANALVGLNQNLGRLVGGPLGGALLVVGGLPVIVAADVVSYLLAALLISRLGSGDGRSIATDAPAATPSEHGGLLSVVRLRNVRAALLVTFVGQIAQGIFVVLFILFVAQSLDGGANEIGLLRGVQAVGAIAGGVAVGVLARSWSPAALTARAAIAFGAVDLLIWNLPPLTTSTAVYVALFIAVGVPGILLVTGVVSTVQLACPEHQRGSAFSALGLVANAGQAIGMLGAGLLTSQLGLLTMLNAQGALYLAAGALAAGALATRSTTTSSPRGADHPARAA